MSTSIPPLTPVKSSNIAAIGYLNVSELLYIQFSSGVVYEYANVPGPIYDRFMASPSKGAFFDQQIKRNADAYPFTKLGVYPLRPIAVYDRHWATVRSMLQTGHKATHECNITFDAAFKDADDEIAAWLELAAMCVASAARREESKGSDS